MQQGDPRPGTNAPRALTPTSMWSSTGIDKRPSQKSLLASSSSERREHSLPRGALHLHRYHGRSPAPGESAKGEAFFQAHGGAPKRGKGRRESVAGIGSILRRMSAVGSAAPPDAHALDPGGGGGGGAHRPIMRRLSAVMQAPDKGDDGPVGQRSLLDRIRQMGGHIQGKEFVRTLARRSKGHASQASQIPTIDNPFGRHSRRQREDFCAKLMGVHGKDSVELCRGALDREAQDRSFTDLENLCSLESSFLMNDCTPVERFVLLRCARLLRVKAGEPVWAVSQPQATVYIVLSGTVVGREERVFVSGDVLGSAQFLRAGQGTETLQDVAERPAVAGVETGFAARTDVDVLGGLLFTCGEGSIVSGAQKRRYVEDWEYLRTLETFKRTVEAGQSSESYVATFLASLDLFASWGWSDVQDFSKEVDGMHVDRGMALFGEGDLVDGLHILQFGEVMVERMAPQKQEKRYGLRVSLDTDSDALPKLKVSRSPTRERVHLAVCGPRSVFGEELAQILTVTEGKEVKGKEAKRGYMVTTLTDCWFIVIPKEKLRQALYHKSKVERSNRSIEVLREIVANRTGWVATRWEMEKATDDKSRSALPLLSFARGHPRWSV